MEKSSYILVLNCGSSSIKLNIFEKVSAGKKSEPEYRSIYDTYIERVKNHSRTLKKIFKRFKKTHGDIFENISKIGHRVVHGGEKFIKPTVVTKNVLKELEKLSMLAPLHNPANIAGIKACQELFPGITNYAVFDTAYYATLLEKAYLYAIPYELYKKHGVRRYGFHGTSHQYVVNEALKNLVTSRVRKSANTHARIVSCHLGNGASITASVNGKAIDTSMGFTPLEGIPMGTRSGDIDPAIIFHLMSKAGGKLSAGKIHTMLEKESGLKGLSEISHDMRDLRDAAFDKNAAQKKRAQRALEVYCYRIAKYIGGYIAAMGGLDCLIFTATIGEKADYIRKWICEYLDYLDLKLDNGKNRRTTNPKKLTELHDKKSKVKIFVIETKEALQIAKMCEKSR